MDRHTDSNGPRSLHERGAGLPSRHSSLWTDLRGWWEGQVYQPTQATDP